MSCRRMLIFRDNEMQKVQKHIYLGFTIVRFIYFKLTASKALYNFSENVMKSMC